MKDDYTTNILTTSLEKVGSEFTRAQMHTLNVIGVSKAHKAFAVQYAWCVILRCVPLLQLHMVKLRHSRKYIAMTDSDNLLHAASKSYETYKRCCCGFAVYPLWSILCQLIAGFVCCACHCVYCLFLCFLYRTSVLSRFLGTPAASGKLTQSP